MAHILIMTTRTFEGLCAYRSLLEYAARDRFGEHTLVEDPEAADFILFAEYCPEDILLERVRQHEFVRRYREKCFVVSERDHTLPLMPGIYASVPQDLYDARRMRTGHYLAMFPNPYIEHKPIQSDKASYLYSFRGAFNGIAIRERLQFLRHPRGLIMDSSEQSKYIRESTPEEYRKPHVRAALQDEYAQLITDSLFVLCPRGLAPSTVRLYETMKAGRVPVIIADDWVAPQGPDWNAFSLRVREQDISHIPTLLEESEHLAAGLGRRARETWEEWFAPEASFHRIVEWCLSIRASSTWPESLLRWSTYMALCRRPYWYRAYSAWKRSSSSAK